MRGRRIVVGACCVLAIAATPGCGGEDDPLGGAPDVRGVRVGEAERVLRAAGVDFGECFSPDADGVLARELLFVADQSVLEDDEGGTTVLVLGATPDSPPPKECAFPQTGDLH